MDDATRAVELSDLQAEAAAMDDLLDAFYAVTYEPAVCVGAGATSPPKGERLSPSRRTMNGPSAAEAAAAMAPPVVLPLSREILNALLPPKYFNGLAWLLRSLSDVLAVFIRSWTDSHGKWQRLVRMTPSTRPDVVRFQEAFDQLLDEQQARAQAICPVREKLFLQVFGTSGQSRGASKSR